MKRKKHNLILKYPMYYRHFSCIGSLCEATCCAGWKISIDALAMAYYKKVGGSFGQRLKHSINFKEKRFCTEQGYCPMLNSRGLCDIYTVLGEDKMCRTCRIYPRHMEDYGREREFMLLLSCPEAARLVLNYRGSFSLHSRHRCLKRGERGGDPEIPGDVLKTLMTLRARMFYVISDRDLSFDTKLKKILSMAANAQRISESAEKKPDSPGYPGSIIMEQYMDMLSGLESVTPQWGPFLRKCTALLKSSKNTGEKWLQFEKECHDHIYMYENLAMHYLYMYAAGAVFDNDLLSKIKLMFFSVHVIHRLHYARWLAGEKVPESLVHCVWIFSRQLDHSDTNLEALETLFRSHRLFCVHCMNRLYF